ncbi:glycerophosphodiester phosphodiesterase [Salinirubellus sp. GCM10025818]|uniref:glycerophosphodiester phosphodiesterase n=1 Tax=Salinirubellus TaxID=2162630 RepID=UPI0030D0B9A0
MRLIADRGFGGMYPENTVRAVEESVALADAVALDVRRCGSGELVVCRDDTVDRVTDGTGRVSDLTLADLAALDVLGTGEGVPRLEAALDAIPRSVGVVLRLRETDLAADVLPTVSTFPLQVVVASAFPGELAAARAADPGVPRAFSFGEGADPLDALSTARGLGATFLLAPVSACTERLVNDAHRVGMSVNAYPVASRSEAERLDELGVDGVVADRWGVLPSPSNHERG